MMSNWKECPRGDIQPQWSGVYVTMNPMGEIVLGRKTYDALGAPEGFVLLYDGDQQRIALSPAMLSVRNAYPARSTRPKAPNASIRIRAYRLLTEFQITLPQTLRFYDATINHQGYLILNLPTARPASRSINHWTKRAKAESAGQ